MRGSSSGRSTPSRCTGASVRSPRRPTWRRTCRRRRWASPETTPPRPTALGRVQLSPPSHHVLRRPSAPRPPRATASATSPASPRGDDRRRRARAGTGARGRAVARPSPARARRLLHGRAAADPGPLHRPAHRWARPAAAPARRSSRSATGLLVVVPPRPATRRRSTGAARRTARARLRWCRRSTTSSVLERLRLPGRGAADRDAALYVVPCRRRSRPSRRRRLGAASWSAWWSSLAALAAIFAIHESMTRGAVPAAADAAGTRRGADPGSPDGAIPTHDHPQRRRPAGRARGQPARALGGDGARRAVRRVPGPLVPLVASAAVVPRLRRADRPGRRAVDLPHRRAGVGGDAPRRPGRQPASPDRRRAARACSPSLRSGSPSPSSSRSPSTSLTRAVRARTATTTRAWRRGSQDYEELDDLLGPHPWLGRGPQAITTYVSRDGTQMILDNQYLLPIAETGVIGLAAMVVLHRVDGLDRRRRRIRRAGDGARAVRRRALRHGRLRRHGGHVRRAAVQPGERRCS